MNVYVFQGQDAQGKGMGAGLFDEFKELTRKADEILGYSIKELCLDDTDGRLTQTRFSQPAVYVVNAFTYFKKIRTGPKPDVVLGHSVGEYNALLASGAFDFQQGLKLVKKRGELLSTVNGGGMAAVMGLSEDRVEEILEKNNFNNLYIANYNSPYQIVIAGLKKEIEQAESLFMDNGAAHYRLLNVHSASHTPYMADVKKKFRNYLKRFKFGEINTSIIANFTARPYKQGEIMDNMAEQLTNPVRWTESIRYLLAKGFDIDDFYEIGAEGASVVKALAVRICNEAGPLDPGILEKEENREPGKYFPDLEAIIISLFNRKPYDRQPKYIAHTGCGDGTLLRKVADIIKNKSLRGRVLDDHPVKLIGIDWNEKALADTTRTLKNIHHLVLKGDVNDPLQVITDLKKMGLRDPENILHVHWFPHHDRANVPPLDMSSEKARTNIPDGTVYVEEQNLVEHFNRWSSVIGMHGLVSPGVHGLEPEIAGQNQHHRFARHISSPARGASCRLPVEADRFLMAAAEAGLFPDPEFFKKYPKTLPFTQITLNRFQRRNYRVRFAQEKDLPVLAQLEKQCWEPALQNSIPVLKKRLKRCPRGQLVLEMRDHDNVVGVIYSQRAANAEEVRNSSYQMLESLHQKDGPVVQLLCLNILPEMQYLNLGDQLLEFMLQRCTLMNGIRTIVGVTRFKDYYKHPDISPQEYVNLRDDRERLKDPTLRFHQLHGVQIKGLVPNYRPQDKKNKGYGVFIQYDPFHRRRREIHIETKDREPKHKAKIKTGETIQTIQSINDFIVKTIISILGKTGESGFSLPRPLMEMGLDSAHLLELGEKIRYQYQIKLEPDFFFKYNTPARIISYLQEHMDLVEKEAAGGEQKTTAAVQKQIHGDKEIAIIGAACRLPGGIRGKEQLWEFLIKGKDAVRKLPGQRWRWPANIDPDNEHKGIDRGGFLDDIASFDASFFRISTKEAELMDPQQRILLELSWECLEDAGYPGKTLAGTGTGVFVGASGSDYHSLLDKHLEEIDPQLGIGTSMSVLPNRISYFYDLRGPSLQIDTACSASLAAVHEALQSIQAGKCQQALVGGIHIMCHSANSIAYYKAGMLSKHGKCKTFDKDADGYVRGEGAVMILLKPLSRALDNGDAIYAVIKGSAINHGGQASGLTVPNPSQQAELLIDAYQTAKVEPETVGYIEAHGTGTPLGDPIEISGLKEAFSRLANTKKTVQKPFCGLGSIKTNIGHLEAAAGLAGLLKVVLALRHQTLPASLNFNELNPHINLANTPFYIVDKNQPWLLPKNQLLRRAGVSSFGSGGTNVHLVLEQTPVDYLPSATRGALFEKTAPLDPPQKLLIGSGCYLIGLSAKTGEALRQKQQDMLTWLEKQGKQHHLADISAALLLGREHFDCRAALVVKNKQELQEKLKEVLEKGQTRDYFKENHSIKRQPRQPVFEELGRTILKELHPDKKINRREYENKLMAVAELYAKGYDLEWQAIYGDNRPPRINLPTYPFAGNHYWIPGFDTDTPMPAPSRVQQPSTKQLKNRPDEPGIDELMLLPRWEEQSLAAPGKPHPPHTVLMVYAGPTNQLVTTILDYYRQEQTTKEIIQIHLSHQTRQISKEERQEEWQCDINDPGGFAACLHRYDSITRTYFIPGCQGENQFVDFNAVANSQRENEIQLLRLVKFLQESDKIDGNMDCFIITRDNYPMGDTPVNPYGAGISGLAFAAAQRDYRLLIRNIDISTRDLATLRKRNVLLKLILDEQPSERGEVIKFNNGSRYKRVFLKPEGSRFANKPELKKQGVYVILGGSGAVGGIITRYLIQEYQAKVAWIGRKPKTSPLIQKKIAALRGYGEPPLYIQADALRLEQMKQAVSVIKSHYSTIDGAIFSGVVYNFANSLNQTNEREFLEVLNVKTKGSINFYAALQEEPLDFMCYFSSVHAFSFTGSANYVAYTSGITFTDGFVRFIGKRSRFPVGIINWGLWKSSLGESIDEKLINRKSGLLEDREGFAGFERFTGLLRRGVLNQVLCLRASQPVQQLMNGKEEETFQTLNREKEQVAVPTPGPSDQDMQEHIKTIILDHLAKSLKISKTQIDSDAAFSDYGVDSIIGAHFVKKLNGALGVNIKTAVLFDYTTVNRLSCRILEAHRQQIQKHLTSTAGHQSPQKPLIKSFLGVQGAIFQKSPLAAGGKKIEFSDSLPDPGLAVIGMAGQFPGAKDTDTFWQNLVRGHDAVRELPPRYIDQNRRPVYKWGGILENRDCFDPLFFNISPREAESMNPHQRLILQESWKALEDAGYNPRALAGSRTGMFIGAEPTGYDFETFTGYSDALIASRLSYYLNLRGPALVVNTGCSSSGAALHLACESLRHGESSLVLAGGVFAMLEQSLLDKLAKHGMLSPGGRCRSFDESADGMVFSEGVGVVVLKRLNDAIAAGDHIYGVITASGMNQDGASNGITAPNGLAQEQLITGVYQRYGINPEEITYIETNGTGTNLGDTVEANALARTFKRFTPRNHYCALGSVDAHIGHTAAATGVIGLIKILLSFRHHQLPGLLHFKTLNPLIELKESAFYVNAHPSGWASKNGKPLMAALNSFGHSGTNVHLVAREYLPPGEMVSSAPTPMIVSENTPVLIPLSARNKDRLQEYAGKLLDFLKRSIPDNADASIRQEDCRESRNALEQDIRILLSDILQVSEEEIDVEEKFRDYGVEPDHLGRLQERLREQFRIEIPFHELFERDSIALLARDLAAYRSKPREDTPGSPGTKGTSEVISKGVRGSKINPAALAYTLQTGREAMEERVVFLVVDIPGLITKLEAFAKDGEEIDNCWRGSNGPGKDIAALFYSDKELSHAIEKWISKGQLRKIAQLWARGFDMNWELVYGETKPRRISLPTYPFAGRRYWMPTGETEIEPGPAALSKPSTSAGKEFVVNPVKSIQENTRDYMVHFFSLEFKLARDQIQLNKDTRTYGADSITFMKLTRGIEKDFHIKMTVREILEHPTIQSLSTHLAKKTGTPNHRGSKQEVNIEPAAAPREIDEPGPPLKSPLSEGQKGLWMLQKMAPGMSAYNVPLCFRIGRGLNVEMFKRACGFLLRQYPILTTVIGEEQGIPFQIHQPLQLPAFQREDISTLPYAEIPAYLKKKAKESFSLERGGLMRIHLLSRSEQEYYLLICIHHIVFDGVSLLPFITTLLDTYRDLAEGKNPAPTPPAASYRDFVRWEREMLESREGEEHLSYWKQQLSGPLPVLELPTDYPRTSSRGFEGQTHTHVLSAGLSQQVKAFAQSQQVSPAMVFLGIFKVLLHRYTGREEIIVGMPTMGRPQERFDSLIGYFINMIPVRSQGIGRHPFTALPRELQLTAAEGLDHAAYPFPALVRELNLPRTPGTPPVFQVTFAYQNFLQSKRLQHFLDQYQHILPLEFLEGINQEGEYELELEVFAREEGFLLNMKYNPGLFAAASITRMMGHYVKLTGEILRHPGLTPGRYSLLSEEERKTILVDWNSNRADYPKDRCIHELFDRQARETPHAVAVVNKEECLAYRELAKKSTGTAIHLQSRGVSPDTIVGIMIERSIEMIIGILGILKAGGAYLPIDPGYPEERKKYMLKDGNSSILLTRKDIKPSPSTLTSTLTCQVSPANLAYIIYTSGSTGKPKGTAVPHRALVNFIYSMSANYDNDFSPKDNCLISTNFCFDASVCEIFMNLVWGVGIVIFPREKAFDPEQLAKAIVERSITFAYLPPGLLRDVFANLKPYRGRLELNKMLVGVEPIKDHVLEDYLTLNPSMRIVNGYGPTEATICATTYRYRSREPEGKRVPIGNALANNTVVLLDNYDRPVPVGVPGELCIAGDGLAKGYINKPELTAERFCRDLWDYLDYHDGYHRSYRSYRSYIIYKTGDLARWLPDGNLEFIGRLDTQVKIRGFRIELNEIESQLNTHPGIKESVALVKEQEGNKQLIAYYVPKNPGHQKEPLDPQQLRGHLKMKLPGYMIPAGFMHLESIPLTPNGKVDRKKLQEQNVIFTRTKKASLPRSGTEEKVLTIWKDLLHREDIGIEDGFFDVGGDSILAVTAAERIKKNLECDFNVTALFQYANIKEISKYITGTKADEPGTQKEPGKKPAPRDAIHGQIPNIETHGKSPYPGYYQDSIAIIGISCHFPGAKNHDEFRNNLREGKESIRFFSKEELQDLGIPVETIENPNYIPVQSTIEGKELFDPGFFNISPRDAEFMDPQLRLLLLQSWQAIEDAGYNCKQIPQTSVYMSAGNSFYQTLLPGGASSTTGIIEHSSQYVTRVFAQGGTIPTMISHHLGLKGPSFFVHTNCSSSLAGIHLACRGLKSGEAKYALVGAAAINSSSKPGYIHQPGLNFSSDGHIKAFDASADGMIGGEGAAVIVLKKALDAIEDGDHIYALIRGISVNNDGADKVGFYAPGIDGQARVIRDVLNSTRIHPESIGYIETHGTGTKLGDPIEFAALSDVYNQYTEKKQFCGIGSVKTNIGHLDTAAGLAGCIKVALSLYHNEIPPSLNFKKPNPDIDMKNSPFYVVDRLEKWEKNPVPHRAALSSFGIGGTNTHAILEQYVAAGTAAPVLPEFSHNNNNRSYIIPLSAKNSERLKVYAGKLLEFLKHSIINLAALAYTLQTGREAMEERVVFLAGDIPGLKTKLKAFVQGQETLNDCWRGKVKKGKDIHRLFAAGEELNQAIETWISTGNLRKIAELWVQGFAMKWELLYGEAKPRRISLPTYPFAGERYWVPGSGAGVGNTVSSIGLKMKGMETNPQSPLIPGAKEDFELMTFEETWQEQALPDTSPKKIKTLVCFLSKPQNQQAVVKTIKTLHHDTRVVFIAQHPTYRKHSRQKYGIAAAEGHAYREALKSIYRDYGEVEALLYLWPLEDPGYIRDYSPIVYILQAMAPKKNPAVQRLNKSFDQTFSKVWPVKHRQGPLLKPAKLLLAGEFENGADRGYLESWIGFQRSMGLVLPDTRMAVIIQDKTAGRQDRETAIKNWTRVLWAELQTPNCQGVLYREGKRHVCRVRPTTLKPGKTLLKPGGTYLITGGCGGLGFLFARHFAETYRAKLVLTGRSPLDEKKKSQIKTLEEAGGRVLYVQADVCDPHRMKQALRRARERFGGIHGVIHAAGILDETGILEKDMRNFQKVLAPKINGTLLLDEVLHEYREPLDFTCYFSSSAAILGDFGTCDYAVGNRFQMAYAHCRAQGQLRAQPQDKTLVINWPLWRDGGKGFKSEENSKIYLKSSGQRFLEAREGIELFERLLSQNNTQHLVLKGQPRRVHGFLGLTREQNSRSIPVIPDPAGKRIKKERPVEMEMKESSLEQRLESDLKGHIHHLLKIPIERLDINKNLAELGFDSIGFVEFAARLNSHFKIEITPGIFFGEPTIGALTRYFLKEHEGAMRWYYQEAAPGHTPPAAGAPGQQASPKKLEKSRYPELVRLNRVTQGRPVFWIHGGMGGVEVYQALAKKIQRPFYGIQARGWMTERAPLHGIRAMAAYYFHIIESLQPEGPYDLGGYSLGGVLAYEVARHLQEVKHTVETIVMLEPPDSTHLRKINPLKKGDILRAVNMALLMTIRQEPGKIARTLVHREELNVNVSEEAFLRQLITLAKSRGLTKTAAQLRVFIRQCAKVQGAYGYGNYVRQPLPDPNGVTAYYFLKTGEAFYGELKPYFTIRDDEMPLDHTDFWQGWRELLPRLHMLEVEASNHLMLLTERKAYETISRFCQGLYSEKGIPRFSNFIFNDFAISNACKERPLE